MPVVSQDFGPFDFIDVKGVRLEVIDRGQGKPLLFLHPGIGLRGSASFIDRLATKFRVIAPSHPGFGASELPAWIDKVDDLSYFYLDLLEALDLEDVVLVGSSFGGWVATSMAVKSTARLSSLVLLDPLGMKFGSARDRELQDVFGLGAADLDRRMYHQVPAGWRDYDGMTDEHLAIIARNRQTEALMGWSPYMHDPKLRWHARRVDVPALVLWGQSDGIAGADYGRSFAAAIGHARFGLIPDAGHLPYVEKPAEVAEEIVKFLSVARSSVAA